MWIPKQAWDYAFSSIGELERGKMKAEATAARLEVENARLRSDMDWFKLRLNQVERERGQLIQAAIGVKIAVPEFVPTYEDPGKALAEMMPDLSSVGQDAADQGPATDAEPNAGIDYSMMPGYVGKR